VAHHGGPRRDLHPPDRTCRATRYDARATLPRLWRPEVPARFRAGAGSGGFRHELTRWLKAIASRRRSGDPRQAEARSWSAPLLTACRVAVLPGSTAPSGDRQNHPFSVPPRRSVPALRQLLASGLSPLPTDSSRRVPHGRGPVLAPPGFLNLDWRSGPAARTPIHLRWATPRSHD